MNAQGQRWLLGLVLAAAVLARLAVAVPGLDLGRPLEDPDGYLPLARSLAAGRGYVLPADGRPTAYRPPLYPLTLVPLVTALGPHVAGGILAFHALLGAATVALTARAATRWGLSSGPVILAAVVVALDPVLVAQARAVMTETLAAFLVALTLACLAESRPWVAAFWGGLGCGLCALCRPSLLPAAGLIVLAALVCKPGRPRERGIRAGLIAVTTLALLLPWAVRNAAVFGTLVWTTTHGGYTLALANNPYYYQDVLNSPVDTVWQGPGQEAWFRHVGALSEGRSEPVADRASGGKAGGCCGIARATFCAPGPRGWNASGQSPPRRRFTPGPSASRRRSGPYRSG